MIPLVVTVESKNGQTRRYAFADSPVRVGRSPFAELQLTEAFVSRWEGTLRFDENEVTYFHVSQTNPTYIDGRVAGVHEEVPIGPTTVLTLGELKLRFERTSVRDEDLRRKGKRQPIKSDDETVAKTVWLDASRKLESVAPESARPSAPAPSPPPAYTPEARPEPILSRPAFELRQPARPPEAPSSRPPPLPEAPRPSTRPPAAQAPRPSVPLVRPESARPVASDSVRIAREVRVLPAKAIVTPAHGNARASEPPSAGSARPSPGGQRPGVSDHVQSLVRPPGGFSSGYPVEPPPDAYAARAFEPPHSPRSGVSDARAWDSSGSGAGPRFDRNDLDALHAEYRVSWEALCDALGRKLESTPDSARRPLAEEFARRFPALLHEPEYRALLQRFNLQAASVEAHGSVRESNKPTPELGAWLRNIAQGVLPPNFNVDTRLTLERVLALLELLTQSFAEINDAQDNIRRHWLGRSPRASILRSDNGRVMLAYMLNPKADWNERLGELESAISDVVMHELSLFKATLEGARGLVESMSPAALAKAEGIELPALDEGSGGGGFLGRLLPRDTPEARLWRRFMNTYEGLMDGDRYQRLFLGRKFARTYLAAMGQREGSDERERPGGGEK